MKTGWKAICVRTFLSVTTLWFIFAATAALAAEDDIRVTISPTNPNPGDIVTASLESYVTDLNQAEMIWYVDGKIIRQGAGEKVLQIQSAGLGKTTSVDIIIKTADIGTVEKAFTIRPASVDLLWQANSYTPPFYKGKALAPSESVITVVAIPNMTTSGGKSLTAKDVVFTWKQNNLVLGAQSGLGKNSFTFTSAMLQSKEPLIEVDASSPANNLHAYGQIVVPITAPKIVFYEQNPIQGVLLNTAIPQSFSMNQNEMSIVAYPYFAEGRSIENTGISYTWKLNNTSVAPSGRQNMMTLRTPQGSGTASLSLSIENIKKLFESAAASLMIGFGNTGAHL